MAERNDIDRLTPSPPPVQSNVQPNSSRWVLLWCLAITATGLLLSSVVITAFVTTTLLNPRRVWSVSETMAPLLQNPNPSGGSELPKRLMNVVGAPKTSKPCDSMACIEQAKLLLRQINVSRDPCEDFYSYVCDDWALIHPLPPGAEQVSVDTLLLDGYTELLAAGIRNFSSQFPELQFLLDRCLHPESTLFDRLSAMFLDATNIHFWMAKSSTRRVLPAEVSRKLGLAFRELGIDAILKFFVVKDPMNETKRFIGLGEPSPVLLREPLDENEYEMVRLGFAPVLNFFQNLLDTDILRFEARLSRLLVRPQQDSESLVNCTTIKSFQKRLLSHMNSRMMHPGWMGGFLTTDAKLGPPFERIEIPLPVFDFYLNKDPSLRPLHVPRAAPRIYRSLFRAIYHWIYNFEFKKERGYSVTHNLDDLRSCLERQYGAMVWADKRVQLNASRTSWSDLWDFLALKPAYEAFLLLASRVSENYQLRLVERWSTSQLFFVYYAAGFCENSNRRFLRKMAAQGPSSPAWFRVNGPLRNMPEFVQAFGCKPNFFMNQAPKCALKT
ncbi:hypothetical protein HPB47_008880 [Ixodes persulcatus]|uniref:Uncharacterized protein n=1 Tax=Ixodes persulcatus TaxID=34615 RepID=A0AC60P3I8_IXOPE|nr:hypothetical protein HPB47_008880 [Ixodes persulcatus]